MAIYIQSGTVTIAASSTSQTETITSVGANTSTAFLVMYSTGADDSNYQATGYFSSTTQLTFERYGTALDCEISYFVVYCDNEEFSVVHGSEDFTTSQITSTVDFGTPIDVTRSHIVYHSMGDTLASGLYSESGLTTCAFTNITSDTTDDIIINRGSHNSQACRTRYQIVTWDTKTGVSVQHQSYTKSLASHTLTAPTDFTEVDMDRSWLYCKHQTASSGLGRIALAARMDSDTQITIYNHYAHASEIEFQIITFPAYLARVLWAQGTTVNPNLTTDIDFTIKVDTTRAFAYVTSKSTGPGTAYPRHAFRYTLLDNDTVRAEKYYTTQTQIHEVQVIDFRKHTLFPFTTKS